jgi:hypothetical protein
MLVARAVKFMAAREKKLWQEKALYFLVKSPICV